MANGENENREINIDSEGITDDDVINYLHITKIKMKTFLPYNESQSDANEWSTRWARQEEIESGAQTLAFYHKRCYVIEKYESADLKYQIEGRIKYSDYLSIRKELEEDARISKKQSQKKAADIVSKRNKRRNSDEGRGQSFDYYSVEHGRQDREVFRLGRDQDRERRFQSDSNRSDEYDSKDRKGKSLKNRKVYLATKDNENYNKNISHSLKDNDSKVEQYTEKDYRNFGWARANNILNAGQNADYRSKFADAKVGRAKFAKSKIGEYIIPVSNIYDSSEEGINNVLVFAKGTISNPIITSVIEIYEYDETSLDRVRRRIYDCERRGIQQKTGELFRRYYASDFKFRPNQQRIGSESIRDSSNDRYGERSGRETSSTKEEQKVSNSLNTSNTRGRFYCVQ